MKVWKTGNFYDFHMFRVCVSNLCDWLGDSAAPFLTVFWALHAANAIRIAFARPKGQEK